MEKDEILSALRSGTVHVEGQFIYGSNYTFMAACHFKGRTLKTVYKPLRGERPLWDFPGQTLARREVAAFLVSEALGWDLVPPTLFRWKELPIGPGSIQLFIEHNPDLHYFNFSQDLHKHLPRVMAFDLLINNADRKAGHLLVSPAGQLFLIDHGLSFHTEDKLRTVVWDHAGEVIPPDVRQDIEKIIPASVPGGDLYCALEPHLQRAEIEALGQRAQALLASAEFPLPPEDRRAYPWPLV